jgi:hypothetical protein
MPSEPLECGQGEALLHSSNGNGVSQYMRGHRTVAAGCVGHPLQDALDRARCHADGGMAGTVALHERTSLVNTGGRGLVCKLAGCMMSHHALLCQQSFYEQSPMPAV